MSNRKAGKGRQTKAATVTKLTKETPGIKIELLAEDEIDGPEGSFASGDDAADRKMVKDIEGRLSAGDIWAWCTAHVRVTFEGLTSDQYLGACSYDSARDFIDSKFTITAPDGTVTHSGYYDDMVSEAIDDLNAQIAKRAHFAACAHCAAVSKGEHLPDPIAHA